MLHFPATPSPLPRRSDSLNATQTRMVSGSSAPSNNSSPSLLPASSSSSSRRPSPAPGASSDAWLKDLVALEEQLHDARRVQRNGQEEDLRYALGVVIAKVEGLSARLTDAYKEQFELEASLSIAKSNLMIVNANNEMLEEALRQANANGQAGGAGRQPVGWRRWSSREGEIRREVLSDSEKENQKRFSVAGAVPEDEVESAGPSPSMSNSGFFKFRLGAAGTNSTPGSRPGTPVLNGSPQIPAAASPVVGPSHDRLELERLAEHVKKLESDLELEKNKRIESEEAKKQVEEEIESLSQALFEEANKMVATERRKLSEVNDALNDANEEKAALKGALKILESEIRAGLHSVPAQPTGHAPEPAGQVQEHQNTHTPDAIATPKPTKPTPLPTELDAPTLVSASEDSSAPQQATAASPPDETGTPPPTDSNAVPVAESIAHAEDGKAQDVTVPWNGIQDEPSPWA